MALGTFGVHDGVPVRRDFGALAGISGLGFRV